jgi:hypothetical protein
LFAVRVPGMPDRGHQFLSREYLLKDGNYLILMLIELVMGSESFFDLSAE